MTEITEHSALSALANMLHYCIEQSPLSHRALTATVISPTAKAVPTHTPIAGIAAAAPSAPTEAANEMPPKSVPPIETKRAPSALSLGGSRNAPLSRTHSSLACLPHGFFLLPASDVFNSAATRAAFGYKKVPYHCSLLFLAA